MHPTKDASLRNDKQWDPDQTAPSVWSRSTMFAHICLFKWAMTKLTKWHVCPAKTQISLGIHPVWSESSLSAWRKLGSLATHWAHSEDWSDWADAQADPSLCWAHSHFVGFVMLRFIFRIIVVPSHPVSFWRQRLVWPWYSQSWLQWEPLRNPAREQTGLCSEPVPSG